MTPDGKYVYVTNEGGNTVSVIEVASQTVVATVTVGNGPGEIAITPDGKYAYVSNYDDNTVSVIRISTNKVEGSPIPAGNVPTTIAITPDGSYAYVANRESSNVSVIDTASNKVIKTVAVGNNPFSLAITPDGKNVYVGDSGYYNASTGFDGVTHSVSVIDTASNKVIDTIQVGLEPAGVGIVAPPPGTPFSAFSATSLSLQLPRNANRDAYALGANFTLSGADAAINPATQTVTLQVGTSTITIPPGSFRRIGSAYLYVGFIKGASVTVAISPVGRSHYTVSASVQNVNLTGTQNPVYITLTIGGDSGATSATAAISG